MTRDNYQTHAPAVVSSATSRAAARSIEAGRGTDKAAIWRYVHDQGEHGATCDEIEVALGLPHQTASARVREMVLAATDDKLRGLVRSGRTRATRSGRQADVLLAWEPPRQAVQGALLTVESNAGRAYH